MAAGCDGFLLVIEQAKQDSVQAIFVQPQFSEKSAGTIAEAVGAKLIEMDPLAYDYLRNLRNMTNNLVHALGGDRFRDDDNSTEVHDDEY